MKNAKSAPVNASSSLSLQPAACSLPSNMHTSDFEYDLPPELIAQQPAAERADARMLVLDRATGGLVHRQVKQVGEFLRPGDLLVVNDTRVIPARLFGVKEESGGRVELLFLEPAAAPGCWTALCGASRRPKVGTVLQLAEGQARATVMELGEEGRITVRIESGVPLLDLLEACGVPPLPPYIHRPHGGPGRPEDRERYQTVYARVPGAVAAPTAGLHFTETLLESLRARGVDQVAVTLHVGPGTFKPVAVEDLDAHTMESERYEVTAAAAARINDARAAGGRIVAVGSTSVRTLETVTDPHGRVRAGQGRSAIFIRPPYQFKAVDAMLTNFHLPRSTLLMMVCALAGYAGTLSAYREAVRERYRFYSYGDCMLLV